MRAAQDFNYKVALASGLRSLEAGRLRQAEEQFRYLVTKFPAADGGYRGLAKVQLELEDRTAALATLRDGAASCSRGGERAAAIGLLQEAVGLDPLDRISHRHLAAALALARREAEAAAEYGRFADAQLAAGGREQARLELAYGLERFPDASPLRELAARLGHEASSGETGEPSGGSSDVRVRTLEDAERRAAMLFAVGDPGAAAAALRVARAHLAAGHRDAASDLLLQLVASGLADHDAQRMLVEVASAVGRPEVARAKCELLAETLRLQGRDDLAREIEQLAQAV